MIKEEDDQSISDIITSLRKHGLSDIKHNKKRPIAAFILCICFIDQMAAFTYKKGTGSNVRCEKFLRTYVPAYSGIKLYSNFRNWLVHNYTSKGKFGLTIDRTFKAAHGKIGDREVINVTFLIMEISNGLKKLESQLKRRGSNARKNALLKNLSSPIIRHQVL